MECKNCGDVVDKISAYCPSCGCPMDTEVGTSAVDELVKKTASD